MSDETARALKDPPPHPEEGRAAILTITLHPNKQMEFNFPGNELLAYGMLEKARMQLDKMALVREFQHAQVSRGGVNGLLRKITGG